jgi:hypothetical protein
VDVGTGDGLFVYKVRTTRIRDTFFIGIDANRRPSKKSPRKFIDDLIRVAYPTSSLFRLLSKICLLNSTP